MTSRSDPEVLNRAMHPNEPSEHRRNLKRRSRNRWQKKLSLFRHRQCRKSEIVSFSQFVKEKLLAIHSPLEALVIIKQLELLTKELLSDDLKNKAILSMREKSCEVMGAEITTRGGLKYEYVHPSLDKALLTEKWAKEAVKTIKTQLELGKEAGWVDPSTGAIGHATLLQDGLEIAVSFKK